jgi:YHS domain-containing protein
VRDNQLRSANFEQRATEKGNPLRCALEGYCPVESKEKGRWVAGNPDNQMAYQGQVFCFSSDAARKQFEAAPEKYAPAQGGNDVVLAVEEDRSVPGSVNHSALWHGRLYLFTNSATLAAFEGNPARYTEHPERATLQTPADSL